MTARTRTIAACLRTAQLPERTVTLSPAQLAEHHAPTFCAKIAQKVPVTRPAGDPPLWLGAAFIPALFALGAAVLAVLK